MSNIFYVYKCDPVGSETRTMVSLGGKVSIPLSEDTVFNWLLKRKAFRSNYFHEFDKAVLDGKLVLASKENIEKHGVVLDDGSDAEDLKGFFIDTTKSNGEQGRIVRRDVFFPQLCVEVPEETHSDIKRLSGRRFGIQKIVVVLGSSHVEVAVFVKDTVPANGLYTLS